MIGGGGSARSVEGTATRLFGARAARHTPVRASGAVWARDGRLLVFRSTASSEACVLGAGGGGAGWDRVVTPRGVCSRSAGRVLAGLPRSMSKLLLLRSAQLQAHERRWLVQHARANNNDGEGWMV